MTIRVKHLHSRHWKIRIAYKTEKKVLPNFTWQTGVNPELVSNGNLDEEEA